MQDSLETNKGMNVQDKNWIENQNMFSGFREAFEQSFNRQQLWSFIMGISAFCHLIQLKHDWRKNIKTLLQNLYCVRGVGGRLN